MLSWKYEVFSSSRLKKSYLQSSQKGVEIKDEEYRYVRCQLAGVHQDGTDYVWTNSSAKGGETLLPYHLRIF